MSAVPAEAPPVGIVHHPDALNLIYHPGIAAVIWQRSPLASFQRWLDGLTPGQLPRLRTTLPPALVREAMTTICNAQGTPNDRECMRLIDDVAALADIFAKLMQASFLQLRLDVVSTNSCRKFHVDNVMARLICTYRGTGTQYGDGAEPRSIFTVPAGAPILLRGTRWPGHSQGSSLRHRSPPIADTGETRLVLVLDPVTEAENAPQASIH